MSIPTILAPLVGNWSGTNHLWFFPGDPVHTSETTLKVSWVAQGQFMLLQYTWTFDGAPQDGVLLLGQASGETVQVRWIDSFHTQEKFMSFEQPAGEPAGEPGAVTVKGSYAAPSGPDWGWQIAIAPQDNQFQIIMHNITPDGEAFLAVEATYTREG